MNGLALCAGVGGIDLGLGLACDGYRTICFVEREAHAAAVLAARMEEGILAQAPVWDDLATFDGAAWRGLVDVVHAGYPCQPFSTAGKRRGVADPRHLWPHVLRIVAECEPRLVFCENVPGHLSLGFDEVCGDLQGMGFRVAAGLFSAAEVGATHRRERLFFLAHADRGQREQLRRTISDSGDEIQRLSGLNGIGGEVGDANGERGRGWQAGREHATDAETADGSVGVGSFPPFPGGDWSGIREHLWPATEPPVRGVADGTASRVDRLRAYGNGVVPLVAAHAFRTLSLELGEWLR